MKNNETKNETSNEMTETYAWAQLFGPGPYRFVGSTREVFQAIPGDANCPMQPGTSCDRCGQGIYTACWFVSSDGRKFKVGADCARHSADKRVAAAAKKVASNATKARQAARVSAAVDAFNADRERFAAMPHPSPALAAKGMTFADYAEWMLKRAGMAGKIRVAREIEKALEMSAG